MGCVIMLLWQKIWTNETGLHLGMDLDMLYFGHTYLYDF